MKCSVDDRLTFAQTNQNKNLLHIDIVDAATKTMPVCVLYACVFSTQ